MAYEPSYKALLGRSDFDAIIISTPMQRIATRWFKLLNTANMCWLRSLCLLA